MGPCKAVRSALKFAQKKCSKVKRALCRKGHRCHGPGSKAMDDEAAQAVKDCAKSMTWPQITLEDQTIEDIKGAINENRELQVEEAKTVALIQALERRVADMNHAMSTREVNIAKSKRSGQESGVASQKWKRELTAMKERCEEANHAQKTLYRELSLIRDSQRQVLLGIFSSFDSFFVYHGVVDNAENLLSADIVNSMKRLEGSAALSVDVSMPEDSQEDVWSRSATPEEGEKSVISDDQPEAGAGEMPAIDPKEVLKYDYEVAKAILRQAEDEFEDRHENFEEHRAAFLQLKAQEGKKLGPKGLLKVDMKEIEETRELSKALVEAGDNFTKAKEACLAAKVEVFDREAESGFLDDVNDGYRMSEEKEMLDSIDPAKMQIWIDQVQDTSHEGSCLVEEPPEESDEMKEWDARSVGIDDSSSMVAEGAARRRIDKWREACEANARTYA